MPDAATPVGGLGTPCSATSVLPQAWKVIKTRDTEAIPVGMHAVTVVGFSLWLADGLLLWQWPLMITNGVCPVLSSFMLLMKVPPRHHREKMAEALDPAVG